MSIYTISSSIIYADVRTNDKTVVLPNAETVLGKTFTICDRYGVNGSPYFITLSTVSGNFIDTTQTQIQFSNQYQSVRVFAQSPTNYAVIQNSLLGNTWL